MSEIKLAVRTFRMGTDKQAALKPLEEAAEVFGAWQETEPFNKLPTACPGAFKWCNRCHRSIVSPFECSEFLFKREREFKKEMFADEIADCIQACVNLADRYGIDLRAAMERCEERNRRRGRYDD